MSYVVSDSDSAFDGWDRFEPRRSHFFVRDIFRDHLYSLELRHLFTSKHTHHRCMQHVVHHHSQRELLEPRGSNVVCKPPASHWWKAKHPPLHCAETQPLSPDEWWGYRHLLYVVVVISQLILMILATTTYLDSPFKLPFSIPLPWARRKPLITVQSVSVLNVECFTNFPSLNNTSLRIEMSKRPPPKHTWETCIPPNPHP